MKATLKKWQKPGSEDIRIYINSPELDRDQKIWMVQAGQPAAVNVDIKWRGDFFGKNAAQAAIEFAESVLAEYKINVNDADSFTWEAVLAIAE